MSGGEKSVGGMSIRGHRSQNNNDENMRRCDAVRCNAARGEVSNSKRLELVRLLVFDLHQDIALNEALSLGLDASACSLRFVPEGPVPRRCRRDWVRRGWLLESSRCRRARRSRRWRPLRHHRCSADRR